jgi:protein O-mannosyl-transferase
MTVPVTVETSSRSVDSRAALLLLAVVLVAIAVNANTLWNGFAYDDDVIILRNARVHQLADLRLIWATPYWPTFGTELGLYRPLAIFAYALEWAAGGGAPWIYHATNIVLHALITALVFLMLRTLVDAGAAAVGALIFAVHPVHTETVANSVGQAELIAAACVLTACVIYARRPPDTGRTDSLRVLGITCLYFAALLAKEAAITLPALLVVLDIAQRRVTVSMAALRSYFARTWLLLFLMASAVVLYLSIRVDVLGSISGLDAAPGLPFLREEHRLLTALRAWPEYIRLLFFPKDLSNDYSPAVILPVESLSPMAMLGGMLLLGTIALALLTPRHPHAGLPAAWFLITILTVSNLLFPIGVVVAERTLYTPSVAVAAVAAFAWHDFAPRWTANRRKLAYAMLALTVGLMSYRTITRNPEWKNTLAILNAMVRDHPESYHTAWLLADDFWRRGDLDRSAFYWEAAMRLWSRDSQLLGEVANFNMSRRNWKRATELLEQARAMHPWVPRTLEMLALTYVNTNRYEEALRTAQEAIRLGGHRTAMFAVMARVYEERGQLAEAAGAWRAATHQKDGGFWVYHAMQARALSRYGDRAGALALADSVLTLHIADSVAAGVITQLRTAIQNDCYRPGATRTCTDPLAGWTITGAGPPTTQDAGLIGTGRPE